MKGQLNIEEGRERVSKSFQNAKHPYYQNYKSMMARCHNPNHSSYAQYGGKGIKVCEEWRDYENGFETFCRDMGRKPHPSWSIDRIRTDLDYSPKNCRWANARTQAIRAHGGWTDNTNIRKTPAGNWEVRIKKSVDGKQINWYNKVFKTKKEAIEARNRFYKSKKLTYVPVERNYKKRLDK